MADAVKASDNRSPVGMTQDYGRHKAGIHRLLNCCSVFRERSAV
jgi:hypothetical protein